MTQAHDEQIEHCFPKPRGTLRYNHLEVLNAILYIAENGAKWRKLPATLGHWHTVHTRRRARTKNGVPARVFEALQQEQLLHFKIEAGSLDGTSIKAHPDGAGARGGNEAMDQTKGRSTPRYIWPWMRLVTRSESLLQQVPRRLVPKPARLSKA